VEKGEKQVRKMAREIVISPRKLCDAGFSFTHGGFKSSPPILSLCPGSAFFFFEHLRYEVLKR
jgi:hypothetical protein